MADGGGLLRVSQLDVDLQKSKKGKAGTPLGPVGFIYKQVLEALTLPPGQRDVQLLRQVLPWMKRKSKAVLHNVNEGENS